MWDLSSLTRNRTWVICIGRQILSPGAPGKSPNLGAVLWEAAFVPQQPVQIHCSVFCVTLHSTVTQWGLTVCRVDAQIRTRLALGPSRGWQCRVQPAWASLPKSTFSDGCLVSALYQSQWEHLQCGNWQDLQIRTFPPKGQFAKHLPAHHGDTIHWTVSWGQYSLEGLMLKLKLQYFGHLTRSTDSVEKTLMLGKIEGGRSGRQRMRRLDLIQPWDEWSVGITDSMDVSFEQAPGVGDGQGRCSPWSRKESDTTEQQSWTVQLCAVRRAKDLRTLRIDLSLFWSDFPSTLIICRIMQYYDGIWLQNNLRANHQRGLLWGWHLISERDQCRGCSGPRHPGPCLLSSHSLTPEIAKDKDPIFKIATPTYAEARRLKRCWKRSQPAVVQSLPYSIWTLLGLSCHQNKLAARNL